MIVGTKGRGLGGFSFEILHHFFKVLTSNSHGGFRFGRGGGGGTGSGEDSVKTAVEGGHWFPSSFLSAEAAEDSKAT